MIDTALLSFSSCLCSDCRSFLIAPIILSYKFDDPASIHSCLNSPWSVIGLSIFKYVFVYHYIIIFVNFYLFLYFNIIFGAFSISAEFLSLSVELMAFGHGSSSLS